MNGGRALHLTFSSLSSTLRERVNADMAQRCQTRNVSKDVKCRSSKRWRMNKGRYIQQTMTMLYKYNNNGEISGGKTCLVALSNITGYIYCSCLWVLLPENYVGIAIFFNKMNMLNFLGWGKKFENYNLLSLENHRRLYINNWWKHSTQRLY